MPDAAFSKHGNIGGAPPDIGHDNAYLLLILGENCLATGERFQDQVLNVYPDTADALYEILNGGYGSGNDMCFYIKTETVHANRVLDASLAIDGIVTRDNMK